MLCTELANNFCVEEKNPSQSTSPTGSECDLYCIHISHVLKKQTTAKHRGILLLAQKKCLFCFRNSPNNEFPVAANVDAREGYKVLLLNLVCFPALAFSNARTTTVYLGFLQ